MAPVADPQQQRLLELLNRAGMEAMSYADLRAAGIAFPAAVATELQLRGCLIERVAQPGRGLGLRLRDAGQVREVSR